MDSKAECDRLNLAHATCVAFLCCWK